MKQLKEKILEEILNKSDVCIKEDFYISYKDMKQILNDNLVESSQIINEKNLQEDFIEGLESLLNREMTSEEIEQLEASDFIDNVCLNDMLQSESDSISNYYKRYFVNKRKKYFVIKANEEYQCSKCNRFFTEEDIFRFDSPCICNICAQD